MTRSKQIKIFITAILSIFLLAISSARIISIYQKDNIIGQPLTTDTDVFDDYIRAIKSKPSYIKTARFVSGESCNETLLVITESHIQYGQSYYDTKTSVYKWDTEVGYTDVLTSPELQESSRFGKTLITTDDALIISFRYSVRQKINPEGLACYNEECFEYGEDVYRWECSSGQFIKI